MTDNNPDLEELIKLHFQMRNEKGIEITKQFNQLYKSLSSKLNDAEKLQEEYDYYTALNQIKRLEMSLEENPSK